MAPAGLRWAHPRWAGLGPAVSGGVFAESSSFAGADRPGSRVRACPPAIALSATRAKSHWNGKARHFLTDTGLYTTCGARVETRHTEPCPHQPTQLASHCTLSHAV